MKIVSLISNKYAAVSFLVVTTLNDRDMGKFLTSQCRSGVPAKTN